MNEFEKAINAIKTALAEYNARVDAHKQQLSALADELAAAMQAKEAAAAAGDSAAFNAAARQLEYLDARKAAVAAQADAPIFASEQEARASVAAFQAACATVCKPLYVAMNNAWGALQDAMQKLDDIDMEARSIADMMRSHWAKWGVAANVDVAHFRDTDPVYRFADQLQHMAADAQRKGE